MERDEKKEAGQVVIFILGLIVAVLIGWGLLAPKSFKKAFTGIDCVSCETEAPFDDWRDTLCTACYAQPGRAERTEQ